jgi:hypothetical protein
MTLSQVTFKASGKYSCEVSGDAPAFQTIIESDQLEVV